MKIERSESFWIAFNRTWKLKMFSDILKTVYVMLIFYYFPEFFIFNANALCVGIGFKTVLVVDC